VFESCVPLSSFAASWCLGCLLGQPGLTAATAANSRAPVQAAVGCAEAEVVAGHTTLRAVSLGCRLLRRVRGGEVAAPVLQNVLQNVLQSGVATTNGTQRGACTNPEIYNGAGRPTCNNPMVSLHSSRARAGSHMRGVCCRTAPHAPQGGGQLLSSSFINAFLPHTRTHTLTCMIHLCKPLCTQPRNRRERGYTVLPSVPSRQDGHGAQLARGHAHPAL
jgi:hypothetical protein